MSHHKLNWLEADGQPIWEEATQTASRFLSVPICVIGVPDGEHLLFRSALGLSHLGLMNPLAMTRQLPTEDSLASYVLTEGRRLVLPDATLDERFAESILVQKYGIRAYIGTPLFNSVGDCVGILAVMDTAPREFSEQAISFLELVARWSMSEHERVLAQKQLALSESTPSPALDMGTFRSHASGLSTDPSVIDSVRLVLVEQLTQELRTPLTSITGMASMLSREIYGPLTPKQQEYAEIVRNSSQQLLGLVDEIIDLGGLSMSSQPIKPTSVDVEMLGQQVLNTLSSLAKQREQSLSLSVEPGSRLWTLDKAVLKQILYHLIFTVIQLSGEGGTVRIHASQKDEALNLALWLSHPWLGDGLPAAVLALDRHLKKADRDVENLTHLLSSLSSSSQVGQGVGDPISPDQDYQEIPATRSRELLALMLSRHLTLRHGGTLTLQGNPETGYRFNLTLPSMKAQSAAA